VLVGGAELSDSQGRASRVDGVQTGGPQAGKPGGGVQRHGMNAAQDGAWRRDPKARHRAGRRGQGEGAGRTRGRGEAAFIVGDGPGQPGVSVQPRIGGQLYGPAVRAVDVASEPDGVPGDLRSADRHGAQRRHRPRQVELDPPHAAVRVLSSGLYRPVADKNGSRLRAEQAHLGRHGVVHQEWRAGCGDGALTGTACRRAWHGPLAIRKCAAIERQVAPGSFSDRTSFRQQTEQEGGVALTRYERKRTGRRFALLEKRQRPQCAQAAHRVGR